jgi:hypothetical protein
LNPQAAQNYFKHRVLITLFYTLFILTMLPVFPMLWAFGSNHFPVFLKIFNRGLIPGLGLCLWLYFILIKKIRSLVFHIVLGFIFCGYFLVVYFLCPYPAERLHVVEYSLLVMLTYRCLQIRLQSFWIFPVALSYALLVGFLDEGTQYFLPNRVGEFKDLLNNWVSSLLASVLLFLVVKTLQLAKPEKKF